MPCYMIFPDGYRIEFNCSVLTLCVENATDYDFLDRIARGLSNKLEKEVARQTKKIAKRLYVIDKEEEEEVTAVCKKAYEEYRKFYNEFVVEIDKTTETRAKYLALGCLLGDCRNLPVLLTGDRPCIRRDFIIGSERTHYGTPAKEICEKMKKRGFRQIDEPNRDCLCFEKEIPFV